jgi:hypothetical protein
MVADLLAIANAACPLPLGLFEERPQAGIESLSDMIYSYQPSAISFQADS